LANIQARDQQAHSDKELSHIKAYNCQAKIVELKNELVQESLNQVEHDATTGEIWKLDIQMKRNEMQPHCHMPKDFVSDLEH
jgi:hypothetical protein